MKIIVCMNYKNTINISIYILGPAKIALSYNWLSRFALNIYFKLKDNILLLMAEKYIYEYCTFSPRG